MKAKMNFAAIDPYIVDNIIKPTESKVKSKDYISWGEGNKYPEYLWDLYLSCATLQSIINSSVDYIIGNGVDCNVEKFKTKVNRKGDTISDLLYKVAVDKMIFGGYAIEIIRDRSGNISELYHLDFMRVRSNEDNTIFYYSKQWNQWGCKYKELPVFRFDDKNVDSVYYSKGTVTRQVYPIPIYGAAVIPCELEKCVNEFHLNNINNGFVGSYVINFNNGVPDDETKEEIEYKINEKFSGYQNAGRILISYNESEANRVTIDKLDANDLDDKYDSLKVWAREQIFTAFRCNPNLVGINTESTGFNAEEFDSAFKLFNRTVIKPIQTEILRSFDKIFNSEGSVTIKPFTLDNNDVNEVENGI